MSELFFVVFGGHDQNDSQIDRLLPVLKTNGHFGDIFFVNMLFDSNELLFYFG